MRNENIIDDLNCSWRPVTSSPNLSSSSSSSSSSSPMASTSSKPGSRFSTFKVFNFGGSRPPAPPPKDSNYLYSATNQSVLSFSNQSLSATSFSQPPTPYSTKYQPSVTGRSPSPAPSRATQSHSSSASLSPDVAGIRKGFMKMASLGKRTFSTKSSRAAPVNDTPPQEFRDDESISTPWNFQVSLSVAHE